MSLQNQRCNKKKKTSTYGFEGGEQQSSSQCSNDNQTDNSEYSMSEQEEEEQVSNKQNVKKKDDTVKYYNRKNFLLKAIQPKSIYDLMAEAFIKNQSQNKEKGVPHFASFESLGVVIKELKDKIKSYSENGFIHILNLHTVTIADAQNQESFKTVVQKRINSNQKVPKQKNHQINQTRVLVKAWNGNGGYEGLSEWLAYEALCLQSKSIIQLQQWIKNLNSDQVESYLEKFYQNLEQEQNQKAIKKKEQKKKVSMPNQQIIVKDQSRRNTLQNDLIKHLQSPSKAPRKTIFNSPKQRLFSSQSEEFLIQEQDKQANSNQNELSQKTNINKRRNTIIIQTPKNKRQSLIFPIHHFQLDSFNSKMHKYKLQNEGLYRKCNSLSLIKQMNSTLETQKFTKNRQTKKNISKGNCYQNQFCEQQKMTGIPDIMASLPLPLPYSLQQKFGKELNVGFASNQEFIQRNMAIEPKEHLIENYNGKIPQGSVRVIATKKALDSWQAQSLGVQLDKFVKKYKEFKQVKQQSEREQASKFQSQNKQFQSFQIKQDGLKESVNITEKKNEEVPEKAMIYFGRSKHSNIDFNEFINQIRPQNKRNNLPLGREDMKVLPVESKYNKEKSEVIQLAKNLKSQSEIKGNRQDKNVSQPSKLIYSDSFQDIQKKEPVQENSNQWLNLASKLQNKKVQNDRQPQQTSDRRYLIQQLGGFKNKKIENLYHQEMIQYQNKVSRSQMLNKTELKDIDSQKSLKLYKIKERDLKQGKDFLIKQKIELTNLLIQNKKFNRKLIEERKIKSKILTKEMRQQKDKQQQWHFTQRATFKKIMNNDQKKSEGESIFIYNSKPELINNQEYQMNRSSQKVKEEENISKNKISSATASYQPDIYSSSPGSRHKTKRNYSSTTRSKALTEKDQILNKYDQIETAMVEGKHQQMSAKQFDKFIKKQQIEMNKQTSLKFHEINTDDSTVDNGQQNKVNINLGLISQTIVYQPNIKIQEFQSG